MGDDVNIMDWWMGAMTFHRSLLWVNPFLGRSCGRWNPDVPVNIPDMTGMGYQTFGTHGIPNFSGGFSFGHLDWDYGVPWTLWANELGRWASQSPGIWRWMERTSCTWIALRWPAVAVCYLPASTSEDLRGTLAMLQQRAKWPRPWETECPCLSSDNINAYQQNRIQLPMAHLAVYPLVN